MATATLRFEDLDATWLDRVDRQWHLQRTGLIEGLAPEDVQNLIEISRDRLFGPNHTIFRPGDEAGGFLWIAVSHEMISQIVGANRPHVSAILSRFRKSGAIRYDRRRLLIDTERLAALVKGGKGRTAKDRRLRWTESETTSTWTRPTGSPERW